MLSSVWRWITVNLKEAEHNTLLEAVSKLPGVTVIHISESTLLVHLGGKIEIHPKISIKNRDDLSRVYTLGLLEFAWPFMRISKKPIR